MKIIIDGTALKLYPLAKPGFHGGTEEYVKELATGLAGIGHTVHVVANDCERDEQRGPSEFWWPAASHPTQADCLIAFHNLACVEEQDYYAPLLVLATNGVDPYLGNVGGMVDAYPVFSECHADLLGKVSMIPRSKCHLTGLGINPADYWPEHAAGFNGTLCTPAGEYPVVKEQGRIFVGNDPKRGLWHVLDIFDKLKPMVPGVTLHVGYDFEREFESQRWNASAASQMLWECRARMRSTEGVRSLGALSRAEVIREQLECQVHVWPADPPNVGSQIHGLTQMECAAAGAALVLGETEAFPEVFAGGATLLPVPGTYIPQAERRVDAQDWADAVAELMNDPVKWGEASRKSRALAEQHTWARVIERWEAMFQALADGLRESISEVPRVVATV